MKRLVAAIALVVFFSATATAAADDDKPELQKMRFIERDPNLTVTTNIAKLFDSEAYENLQSGMPSTIVIATAVYAKDSADPLTFGKEVRTVVYDLWDEQYVIRIDGAGGRKTRKVKYRAEALKILTAVEDMPIAPLADIPYQDVFYLRLTVQLNPVSKETLAEVRKWLSQGTGGGVTRGVIFGSFVNVFVNPKVADADRVLRIRSQPFYRPKP